MKRPDTDDERRTFWPRPGPAGGVVPDLGDDRPCENCGYNLRGLPFDSPCPECGATWGITPTAEPIPWNEERGVVTFLATMMMVLAFPRDLAAQIWRRDTLWVAAAKKFRRINIALATIGVSAVVLAVTAMIIGPEKALLCLPIDVMSIAWWFIWLSAQPARFFRDKGVGPASRRANVLNDYLSAPLALSLLHVALLALPVGKFGNDALIVTLFLHGMLILLQIVLLASAESAMLWQLVDIPRSLAYTFGLGNALLRSIHGAVYVGLIPALVAMAVGG